MSAKVKCEETTEHDSGNIAEIKLLKKSRRSYSSSIKREEKVKAATLGATIDTKVSSSVRNFYRQATLQMSKLAKKVIDIEKYPADKSHMIEKSKESSSEKKGLRINKRKNQHNDKKQAINK